MFTVKFSDMDADTQQRYRIRAKRSGRSVEEEMRWAITACGENEFDPENAAYAMSYTVVQFGGISQKPPPGKQHARFSN